MGLDFWYDEVFTLKNYVLVPLAKTVTDYSFPNNHVLFSLLGNLYFKMLGIGDLYRLMDFSWLARLLPLAATLGTLVYLYLAGRAIFDKHTARLALLFLATTIPFYNFGAQFRGFSPSMFLLTMLLFHTWRFEQSGKPVHAALIVAATALALYTIPLNLYFVLTLALLELWLARLSRHRPRALVVFGLVGLGIGLAALCYLPILKDVLHNRFVQSHGLFHFPTLGTTLPQVLWSFLSHRYLLMLLVCAGLVLAIASRKKKPTGIERQALFLALLLLGPFVVSFVRGDRPYLRVFLNLTPVFALLGAICTQILAERIRFLKSRAWLTALVLAVYCHLTFAFALGAANRRIRADIEAGIKSQDIYHNYYLACYQPLKLARTLKRYYEVNPIPVVLHDVDWAALPEYLGKFGIKFHGPDALEPVLRTTGQAYCISAFPQSFTQMISRRFPGLKCLKLNQQPDFHNLFFLSR